MSTAAQGRFRTVLDAAVAVVLPARCPGCGRVGAPVCSACVDGLRRPPRVDPPPPLDDWAAPFVYEGVVREIVARLKYRNQRAAVPWLASAMVAALPPTMVAGLPRAAPFHMITWVPASSARRRASGFDHGEVLARAVARRLGAPVAMLVEREPGLAQTGRTRAERSPGPALHCSDARARGCSVLLVDDVVTTGASLRAAASVLRAAGARRVVALTAAATPPRGA